MSKHKHHQRDLAARQGQAPQNPTFHIQRATRGPAEDPPNVAPLHLPTTPAPTTSYGKDTFLGSPPQHPAKGDGKSQLSVHVRYVITNASRQAILQPTAREGMP